MSQQIQITGGAKVRDLQDVIIGTSGVLSSVAFDVANGVPRLDSNGKILVSQLPNSVMEYKGTWNAATNTPTLANGTGNQGDVYLCNVAGTVNFGAGPISFIVGDSAVYSGSIWQRSGGATGSVTSVGLSTNGGAITIGNSPITTSGTITANFNGTNLQYVNGAGNLTTFPTLITSIGLTMPSAFSVSNSPLTANGTIAVTGAGTTAQYIRGDGSLATFPTIATEAQRLITEVYNETGATLTKGTVVYINGGHGNSPTVTKAIATGDATSAQTYGIVQTDITNMNNGYVVVIGSLGDLDTQAYANGTQLYLSSTVAGQWTSVKQYAPAHLVYVAIVTRSHPTQGVVEVRIQNGFEMDELHNVSAQSPLNNQGLFYNTSTSLWENKSIATALGYTPADDSLVVHLAGTETITGVKNFNVGLTLQTGYYPTPALGYVGLGSNGSGITILTKPVSTVYNNNLQFSAASNTYNFPNASGTISLTSDLANYVDLTTAQTIGGTKTFSDATKNNGGIFLQNASSSSLAGYMNLGGLTNGVKFTSGGGISNSFTLPSATGYTFTFPNATGTIALTSDLTDFVTLSTAQTISGIKTFSSSILSSGIGFFSTIGGTNYGGIVGTPTYFQISAGGGSSILLKSDNGTNAIIINTLGKVDFGSTIGNGTYTYTLPSATGTIALVGGSGVGTVTSVAALTIGTSGTDLSSTVATSTTTPVITLNVPTASAANRGALSSADWSTFNSKQGTITLTTTGTSGAATFSSNTLNIPQYQGVLTNPVTGTGTTNYLPKFTGTSTIGNSSIQDDGSTVSVGNTLKLSGNSNSFQVASIFRNANRVFFGGDTGGYYFQNSGNTATILNLNDSGNLGLGVTPSAWYSAGGYASLQVGNASLFGRNSANSELYLSANAFDNSSGNPTYITTDFATRYVQNDGVHSWLTAPSGTAGNAITFTQAMTLFSDGNLLLTNGTVSNAGYKLDVNGTGRFAGNLRVGQAAAATNVALIINGVANKAGRIQFQESGTDSWLIGNGAASENGNFEIYNANGQQALTFLKSTSAATFSSSVTATSFNLGNGQYLRLTRNSGALQYDAFGIVAGTDNTRITITNDFDIVNGSLVSQFKIAGSGAATFSSTCTATGFFESSDSRLKTLIQDNYQTKGIASITPKLYTKNGKVELGYYAQDFIGVLDSAVSKGSDDMLSLSYREVLVAKVYALEQRIKELENK